ncbi:uncharacterized protein BT62DRAFT_1074469 [Guyanagaster necrorhizus]|uniref:INO80 complex subunit B-like conserved region domain-containing protein n=1 Tax=Guyanagaster necrorhizus TaxID=856835 RepID=A0A9P8AU57_9AGAR|nr:uncharacterized protein BT62DRAFT_1074469 [Guyanagaster necrorhizus MCA 3950]KAG7447935.1 hypothetical protein BT62DRAFT_1074469 [Guyanagaster necrorhizus MCA 3950]
MRRNEVEDEVDMEGADYDAERYEADSPEEEDGDEPEEEDEDDQVGVTVLDEDVQSNDDDVIVEEEEDDQLSNTSSQPAQSSRLKIKLKLPTVPSSTSNTATPAPEEYHHPPKRSSARTRRIVPDSYLESSEDEDNNDDDDERSMSPESESTPQVIPSKKRLTSRQAVLANVVDSSHVSLDGDTAISVGKGRKKQLNETELALRREETARKRKNLSEKKLEDEKVETINRLLKKQTRPRGGKRNGTTTGTGTPSGVKAQNDSDEEAMEVEGSTEEPPPAPIIPVMYRWISSSWPLQVDSSPGAEDKVDVDDTVSEEKMDIDGVVGREKNDGNEEGKMILTFSVPPSLLPEGAPRPPAPPRPIPKCNVEGCKLNRKYRLVRNWDMGACGMAHLKLLQA